MKTAEQHIASMLLLKWHLEENNIYDEVAIVIENAQKEAYNSAIEDFAGKIESDCGLTITKDRIRNYYNQLKKP